MNILKVLIGPFRSNYFKILGLFLFEYVPASFSRGSVVNVASSIDDQIPERKVVKQYLDIFYLPIILSAKAGEQKKNLKLREDINQATSNLEKIYHETCMIYRNNQSTFRRTPAKYFSVKILHLFDRNRNCYPSLHAQVLAEVYSVFLGHEDILSKVELIKRTVSILEACFLTKQHSINDIAAGFAGVTILDLKFSKERAEELLSYIFLHQQYGMSQELCADIRNNMVTLYRRLLSESQGKVYSEVLTPTKTS